MIFLAAALVATTGSVVAAAATDIPEPNPKAMSQAEIRAYNANLDRQHRYYIRCKRSVATGSLTAREFSCRTNAQWAQADVRGNQESRDIMDEMTSKSWNSSN
jgi:hypothetical protein